MLPSTQRPWFSGLVLSVAAISLWWTPTAVGQGLEAAHRTFAEKPIGILWYTGFSEARAMNYFARVADEFKFADDLSDDIREDIQRQRPDERPVKGMALYMVKGLVPAFEEVEFVEVADEKAFNELLEARRKAWGEDAELTGTGNKRTLTVTHTTFVATQVRQFKKTGEDGKEYTVQQVVPAGEGDAAQKNNTWTQTTYFRLSGNVVYTGHFPELHTMTLPASDVLGVGSERKPDDLYIDVDLTQIPRGFKDLFWNTVNASAGTWLQQKDVEADYRYGVRRPVGDCGLALMKAVIYDVDRVTVSVRLASDNRPLRARVNADVRENSNLAKALRDLRKSRPVLASDDRAIFTLSSAWNMPATFREVVTAIGPMIREGAQRDFEDAALLAAVDQMATAFEATGERGQFETCLRLGGTADSGPVLYGGMRVENGQQFAQGFNRIVSDRVRLPGLDTFKATSGRQYLRVPIPEVARDIGTKLTPSHLYVTGAGSAVWFALGTESAYHMLEHQLGDEAGDHERPAPRGSSLMELTFDATRLVTPGDEAGFDKLGPEAELEVERMITGTSLYGELPPPRGFLKQALSGEDASARLIVDADDDGLFIRGEVDEPLGRWFIARYLATVDRIMTVRNRIIMREHQEARRREEDARRKAEEAAKKAADDRP